jgi:hypothetical protein
MDYSGFVFGDIEIIKRADGDLERCRISLIERGRTTSPIYTCKCLLCGNIFNMNIYAVKSRKYKNCGCNTLQYDLRDKRFGKLIAKDPIGANNHKEMKWRCLCDCGNTHITTSNLLRKGFTTQCRACSIKQIGEKNKKYDVVSKRLYRCYANIKTRCTNKKQDPYNRYVNRGIDMCEEWKNSYVVFQDWAIKNGYAENLTIDRIDNDGNYEPSNCRWVDRKTQSNNRRTNLILKYNGEEDTLSNWSDKLQIPYHYIQYRVYKGCELEEIVNEFNNTRHKREKR